MQQADIRTKMVSWFSMLKDHQTPNWDALPDLDLYMDQVITYLERQMKSFAQDEEDRLITSSMINNYVKHELIPRPVQKKYTRDHLAYLIAISILKQVLPITDISNIIRHQTGSMEMEEFYDWFRAIQDDTLHAIARRIEAEVAENNNDGFITRDALGMLAFRLALEASANILAAKKIIRLLCNEEDSPVLRENDDNKKKNGSGNKPEKNKKAVHDDREVMKENRE